MLGIASFAASVVPGALLAGAYLLVMSLVNAQPPGADTVAYAKSSQRIAQERVVPETRTSENT